MGGGHSQETKPEGTALPDTSAGLDTEKVRQEGIQEPSPPYPRALLDEDPEGEVTYEILRHFSAKRAVFSAERQSTMDSDCTTPEFATPCASLYGSRPSLLDSRTNSQPSSRPGSRPGSRPQVLLLYNLYTHVVTSV